MLLTWDLMNNARSDRGGWNKEQIKLLSGAWPPERGWLSKLIGQEISDEMATSIVNLKNKHFARMRKPPRHRGYPTPKLTPVSNPIPWAEQYQHPNWQRVRLAVLSRDEFRCTDCGATEKLLHVHHQKYEGNYIWEVRMRYMTTLCDDCHKAIHAKQATISN